MGYRPKPPIILSLRRKLETPAYVLTFADNKNMAEEIAEEKYRQKALS
jgi:hypothetical protein